MPSALVIVLVVVRVIMMVIMVVIVAAIRAVHMVVVMMIVASYGIGTTLGLERRIDRGDLRTGGLQQRFDIARAAHAQAIGQKFDRHMAVAEMPGEPRQRRRIRSTRFEQGFGFRHDFNETAVVEQQNIVVAQAHRLGEVELDAGSFHAEEKSALGRALHERKYQRVDDAARLAIG